MNNFTDKIAILTGDPNGIGAEITIKALNMLNMNFILFIKYCFNSNVDYK